MLGWFGKKLKIANKTHLLSNWEVQKRRPAVCAKNVSGVCCGISPIINTYVCGWQQLHSEFFVVQAERRTVYDECSFMRNSAQEREDGLSGWSLMAKNINDGKFVFGLKFVKLLVVGCSLLIFQASPGSKQFYIKVCIITI